jgi:pyrimidine deaminase RibD-like protein
MPFGKAAGKQDDSRAAIARGSIRHRITPPGCSENLVSSQVSWLTVAWRHVEVSDRHSSRLPAAHEVSWQWLCDEHDRLQLRGQPRH